MPFAPSGTEELQENVVEAIEKNPEAKILLLEKHGLLAMEKDAGSAFDTAEHHGEIASIAMLSEMLS